MNITFVASGSEQLGITLLANMAKYYGHEVNVAFSAALFRDHGNKFLINYFDDTKFVLDTINDTNPKILAFSALTSAYQWMLYIAREAKKNNPNIITVFGGVHVSAVSDLAIQKEEVDYVVVGEGEEAFIKIIDSIERSDFYSPITNTKFKNPEGNIVVGIQKGFNQELDLLPPYTKEIWEGHTPVEDFLITMASRGCPYRCTFCFNNFFAELPTVKNKGKYVRLRSVNHVINELIIAKSKYLGLSWIDFEDDIFTVNKAWLKEFLERYKNEIGIPFQCLSHPRYMDDEIAQWLKDAGCRWVQIGVQTMDEEYKNQMLKRYEKSNHVDKALSSMIKAGLKVKVDHMFGLPDEPIEAQETARILYANHCPARIQTFWTCFLPGTEMLRDGVARGIVSKEQEERLNEGIDFFFFNNPDNIKDKDQVKIYEGYQMLFKIYPLLSKNIRLWLTEKKIRWIPSKLKYFIGMFAEIINAFLKGNPDLLAYMKYYKFHTIRIIKRKYFTRKYKNTNVQSYPKKEVQIASSKQIS